MAGETFAREPFAEESPGWGDMEVAAGGIVHMCGQAADAACAHLAQGRQGRHPAA